MLVKDALEICGELSSTDKMPGWSYSLPPSSCRMGGLLRKVSQSVCSRCYACKGRYRFRHCIAALKKRLEAIEHPLWGEAMTVLLHSKFRLSPYFRWHDSGDLQGLRHLVNIADVCWQTPRMRHWLPTKEYDVVRVFLKHHKLPPNLTIRCSAYFIDQMPFDAPTPQISTVTTKRIFEEAHECLAVLEHHSCGDCRACWSRKVAHINYRVH